MGRHTLTLGGEGPSRLDNHVYYRLAKLTNSDTSPWACMYVVQPSFAKEGHTCIAFFCKKIYTYRLMHHTNTCKESDKKAGLLYLYLLISMFIVNVCPVVRGCGT